jgi:hypothetical protein
MFQSIDDQSPQESRPNRQEYICEQCVRSWKQNQMGLVKVYKHCILDQSINPQRSRDICHCSDVARFDINGDSATLYPIEPTANHRTHKCRLYKIPGLMMQAKQRELETPLEFQIGVSLAEDIGADILMDQVSSQFPFGNTHVSLMIGPLIIENGVEE